MDTIYDYVEAGFRVFPLWNIAPDGSCECDREDCEAAGKHPRIANWQHSPHWSDEQLDFMVEHQIGTGFGVCLDDHLVIDVDPRNGGLESLEKLPVNSSSFIVSTSNGGKHIYFRCPKGAYVQHLPEYPGIDFKTSGFVVGAGSLHRSGERYTIQYGAPYELDDAPDALLELINKPDTHRAEYKGSSLDVSDDDIEHILSFVDPDIEHDAWYKIGMAIHHATNGTGFDIWDQWSKQGKKYPGHDVLERRWHSFGKAENPVTIGTLIYYAEQGGYVAPVTFEVSDHSHSDHPFDIDGVDLLRPPSLVGKITQWINSQSRYPREHLAVAAALTATGNIAGLRYTDDKDGVCTNLLNLCIAGSATGKEAILQAAMSLHEAVQIQPAVVGNIKSEQEIVRNLTRHQPSYYIVDEVGYLLQKLESARQRGGASYLEGVIATVMSVYSKADGTYLINGDLKEDMRGRIQKDIKQCEKKIEDNEDESGFFKKRAEQLKEFLPSIDLGIQRPFMSLLGFTTPVSFDSVVTAEQATNGFIGRCLLTREPETNPKRKRGFKRPKGGIPTELMMALQSIHDPGNYDAQQQPRIEYYGERIEIPTESAALDMLEDVADALEDYAEQQKGNAGLEAVVRRGYEHVSKLSLILSVGEGVRTSEHVRWAYAYVVRDIAHKIDLASANIKEGSDDALRVRVLTAAGEGEREGTIIDRVSCSGRGKYSKVAAKQMLDELVARGEIEADEQVHPVNNLPYFVYRPA